MTTLALAPRARRLHWHHPEWCAVAIAACAWLVLGLVAVGEPSHLLRAEVAHAPDAALSHACVMATAMMAPLSLPLVRHVAVFSVWRHRYRAALAFLAGYLGVWTLASGVLSVAAGLLVEGVGATAATAAGFGLAIGALVLPGRRQLVRQCTAFRPLALHGVAADLDCLRFGAECAPCVATCWPLMLAATVNHGLLVMAAASALALAERRRGHRGERLVLLGTLAIWFGAQLLAVPHLTRTGDTDPSDHRHVHALADNTTVWASSQPTPSCDAPYSRTNAIRCDERSA